MLCSTRTDLCITDIGSRSVFGTVWYNIVIGERTPPPCFWASYGKWRSLDYYRSSYNNRYPELWQSPDGSQTLIAFTSRTHSTASWTTQIESFLAESSGSTPKCAWKVYTATFLWQMEVKITRLWNRSWCSIILCSRRCRCVAGDHAE